MRTTLDIDNDILDLAKGYASSQGMSIGKALSVMVRKSFEHPLGSVQAPVRNGLRIILRPPTSKLVTLELVNHIRDEI